MAEDVVVEVLRKEIRKLQEENASLRRRLSHALKYIEDVEAAQLEPWPMPEQTVDPVPPDTWGG